MSRRPYQRTIRANAGKLPRLIMIRNRREAISKGYLLRTISGKCTRSRPYIGYML